MSVVGFDVGNASCYVAVARAGGIETVANEYSDRCTPAVVSFNSLHRLVGISAKNQMVINFKTTILQFKRLIGRNFDEPAVQEEIKQHPNDRIIRMDDGGIGIKVKYKEEERVFSPEQIMSMLLSELKNIAQANLQAKVTDCVISVPSYFTDYQRRALLLCTQVAGLNCLKIMNDTSAVALNYGLFKQAVPAPEEKPHHVAFVDMGQSSLQVCIAAFNKGKIKVLSTASDPNLGGRNFDERLKQYFAKAFLEKYKIDATKHARAWIRLGTEVEKIKKQISTISSDLPLNIECFMEDKDVSHTINRKIFEELCKDLIDRIAAPILQAIAESGLKLEEIDAIELVGGSTRIPALKEIVKDVFQKENSTTLNQDEAVARGCAIQCAMLSHTVKVRDIEVLDAATYPINISWESQKADEPGAMEVFKKHHSYPFTKMLTFHHRVEPFRFRAFYHKDVPIPHYQRDIGEFIVNAAAPTESNDTSKVKVKVKVRLDIHGCFTVSSASMVETLPSPPPAPENEEPMETDVPNGEESTVNQKKQNETEADENNITEEKTEVKKSEKKAKKDDTKKEDTKDDKKKPEPKKAKKLTKSTELSVIKNQSGYDPVEINRLVEIENELIAEVRLEKERADAKNMVEEYVYSMRSKIYDIYADNITEQDREQFSSLLTQTEDWLYDEGEDQLKQVYINKLAELKKIGQPIADRYQAYSKLPDAFESFGSSIQHYRKILDLYDKKDEKYVHLEEAEMKKVEKKVDEKFQWFSEKMQANGNSPPHATPPVYPSQVLTEKKLLDNFCNPIVTKAKPVEPPPPPPPAEPSSENGEKGKNEQPKEMDEKKEESTDKPKSAEQSTDKPNLDMEID